MANLRVKITVLSEGSEDAHWTIRILPLHVADLLGNLRSWFVICDYWILIRFVYFEVRCF